MRPKPYEYVQRVYGVPAEYGRCVVVNGRTGVIVEDLGNYIGVCFDDGPVNRILPYHPTGDGITYLGMRENPRKLTRSQKRYREYLANRDCFENFRDFLLRHAKQKRYARSVNYGL
jgi:hypothetical protein